MDAGQFSTFITEIVHFITGPIARMVAALLIIGSATGIQMGGGALAESMQTLSRIAIMLGLLLAGSAILSFLCHC